LGEKMTLFGFTEVQIQEIGISLGILVAAIFIGRWLVRGILIPILRRLFQRTKTTIDDVLLNAIADPAYWLLLFFSAQYAFSRLNFLDANLQLQIEEAYFVIYLAIFFTLAWRVVSDLSKWLASDFWADGDSGIGKQLMPFISRVALILVSAIAGIVLLSHFNVNVSGLVATLGVGSLAVALAAQEALRDTIAGFIIMIDRPYRIGDRIEILELGTWGDVMDIGLRSTRIRTRDNRMAVVPNSVIGSNMVVNHSYPDDKYRLEIELGVAYGSDVETVRQILIEAVGSVEGVLQDERIEALFLKFGDSALIFRVRWWLDDYYDTRRMFDKVNTAMYSALRKAGIDIPFPQRVVHHEIDEQQEKAFSRVFGKKK
jgi:small-conductance mechanosensitive channel